MEDSQMVTIFVPSPKKDYIRRKEHQEAWGVKESVPGQEMEWRRASWADSRALVISQHCNTTAVMYSSASFNQIFIETLPVNSGFRTWLLTLWWNANWFCSPGADRRLMTAPQLCWPTIFKHFSKMSLQVSWQKHDSPLKSVTAFSWHF